MKSLPEIVKRFPDASIAVIGDLCLDMYQFLSNEKSEISVETGLRTRSVTGFKHEAGGAGNVAINLKTLGASQVDIYGVSGNDPFGKTLTSILETAGVNCSHIRIQDKDWNTHVYQKSYIDGKEEPRNDFGNFNVVQKLLIESLLNDLESNINRYQAIIINEQVLDGYHNEQFQAGLSSLIERYEKNCLWITDCRHLNHIYNRSIRKLNIHEARTLYATVHTTVHGEEQAIPNNEKLVKWLNSHWKKPVVVTLGPEGAIAADDEGLIKEVPGINLLGQLDTVGAGDAFLSGFALTLASGNSLEEALSVGNYSANVSVTKLFETGHPSVGEVLEMGSAPDYRYQAELAADARKASYIGDTEIELIDLKKTAFPKVAIFDHDGTISTLRQGWEPIMRDVAINAILGESIDTVSAADLKQIESAVEKMIEDTTGIQTITQMHYLRDMVRSSGYVPSEKILTPLEYKNIYNEKLISMVDKRIDLFRKGYLNIDDVTMKGAVAFLGKLRDAGTVLYLASGTDQDDVRNEASVLGYSEFFSGGIFGSVGDAQMDPKRKVLENIIRELPSSVTPGECYVFGDGPVEMREAARNGLTGIGLVSDEKQRFGTNPEKRTRLILGGAKALIPDFSWMPPLIQYLEWEA